MSKRPIQNSIKFYLYSESHNCYHWLTLSSFNVITLHCPICQIDHAKSFYYSARRLIGLYNAGVHNSSPRTGQNKFFEVFKGQILQVFTDTKGVFIKKQAK